MSHSLRLIIIIPVIFLNFPAQSQYSEFLDSYDLLSTIAGKGNIDVGGENGWLPAYEGGPATVAELSRPHIAMADSVGNIYIADKDAHAIRKVNTQGVISTVAGTNLPGDGDNGLATEIALNAPNGLWVKADGTFYILDLMNHKIRKVDTGSHITTVVNDESGISLGRGLWVSRAEDTIWYASGSQIKMWTGTSGIVPYATGFSGLGNIVQDPDGFLVATDRTANQVYRISKEGDREVIAGNGASSGGGDGFPALETGFNGVRGVWFLEDNTYFLATHEGSQVWHIDSQGIAHLFLDGLEGDEYHSGDGENYRTPGYKISEARAVTVDHQGNILITENDRGFIRKIEKRNVDALMQYNRIDHLTGIRVFPNPSSDEVKIKYRIAIPVRLSVTVYNIEGEVIDILLDESQQAGEYVLTWQNREFPVGVYYIQITSEAQSLTSRLCLIK